MKYKRVIWRVALISPLVMACVIGAYTGWHAPLPCHVQERSYTRDEWESDWPITDEECGEPGSGKHWNLRHLLLLEAAHDGTAVIREVAGKDCAVLSGTWTDPYTGVDYTGPARGMHIDHRVALAEACRSGGCAWSDKRKAEFYVYRPNLVVTRSMTNLAKGDSDPSDWFPWPEFRCNYVMQWMDTKIEFDLDQDQREAQTLLKIEGHCKEGRP